MFRSLCCVSRAGLHQPSLLRSTIMVQKPVSIQRCNMNYTMQVPPEKYFDKVLIANRGEIACRIIKTAKRLGMKTVAVHSEADSNAKHVKMADEAYCLGGALSSDSYLRMDRVIKAAKETGAQAVHPGFGFLSENATFAETLEKEGIVFVGPSSFSIHAMGDKIESKKLAKNAGVNTIPGFLGEIQDEQQAVTIANEIGYPVMVKASAGGGGKGMRISWNDAETRENFRLCKREAKNSFGDDRMLIEKFIDNPRHVEIQVLGDSFGNILYLPERECSIQRRNQKVIEEAPSMALDEVTRRAMGQQAARLAQAVKYKTAGTVEMLVDSKRNFYFLEMNTRLQVEHPITEYITGIDLVEQMFRVAAGKSLSFTQDQIKINGWATECRIYAEDPYRNFLPSIGQLTTYFEPDTSEGDVRVDSGIEEGSEISIYYDPMICKLVTHGPTRAESIKVMKFALDTYLIKGVNHNVPFLRSVLENQRYLEGRLSTKFIPEEFPKGFDGFKLSEEQGKRLIAAAASIEYITRMRDCTTPEVTEFGPYEVTDTFVIGVSKSIFSDTPAGTTGDEEFTVGISYMGPSEEDNEREFSVLINGQDPIRLRTDFAPTHPIFFGSIAGKRVVMQVNKIKPLGYTLQYFGTLFNLSVMTQQEKNLSKYMPKPKVIDSSKLLVSPMPGNVVSIAVKPGDKVIIGQELCVVEAMKMQNVLRSERDGIVKQVPVQVGQNVAVEEILIQFE